MFSLFEGASLKIAKNLIKVTGIQGTLQLVQTRNVASVGARELMEQVLALNACNLHQTLKEDFIARQLDPEDCQDIVDDYLVENLRQQQVIPYRDGAHLMEICLEIQGHSERYKLHWIEEHEDATGPGPRYYCVKDLLRRLGNEKNYELHDALFEFVYIQHKHFIEYFRTLLEPLGGSGTPAAAPSTDPGPSHPPVEGPPPPAGPGEEFHL